MDIDQDANDDSPGDFQTWSSTLLGYLNQVGSTNKFATSEKFKGFVDPWLELGGQRVSLPLGQDDVELIRRFCSPAPVERGNEALHRNAQELDDWEGLRWNTETWRSAKVGPIGHNLQKKSWELDRRRFELANPDWEGFLGNTIVPRIAQQLDLWDVRAVLQKLLLHGEGSFSESQIDWPSSRILGTLAVCFPSQHSDGDFHLSSGDQKVVLRTTLGSESDITVLAWHVDATHEIKPLTQGYRLILIYDLFQIETAERQRMADIELITEDVEMVRRQLLAWPTGPTKIAYPLSCELKDDWYLSFGNLTGRNRNVAVTLRRACALDGFIMLLANMTRTNMDVDEGRLEETNTVVNEVLTCSRDYVMRRLTLDDSEILGVERFLEQEPDSMDESESTENTSRPDTFRYRDPAIIIVRVEGLSSLLDYPDADTRIDRLVSLACDKINSPSCSQRTTSIILDFFLDALDAISTGTAWNAAGLIAYQAVELGRHDVFMAAVTKGITNWSTRKPLLEKLWNIVEIRYQSDEEEHFDWEKWYVIFFLPLCCQ